MGFPESNRDLQWPLFLGVCLKIRREAAPKKLGLGQRGGHGCRGAVPCDWQELGEGPQIDLPTGRCPCNRPTGFVGRWS